MFTYCIDKQSRIVYLEGGDPSLEEWQQTLLAVFADPDFQRGFHFLSDRRLIEKPRSSQYLRAAIGFLKDHAAQIGNCKWATVVSTTSAYGMGRMAQILSDDTTIAVEVFTSLEQARKWLME